MDSNSIEWKYNKVYEIIIQSWRYRNHNLQAI